MKFFDGIKIFKKNSSQRKYLEDLICKLPRSDDMAKELLNSLGNDKTKCVFDEDIKGNYYVYLNDTIYLSSKQKDQKNYERLCVISHECVHSVQPKYLQNINFVLSNIEILFFVTFIILYLFKIVNIYYFWGYIVLALLSIIARLILELWATFKAPKLSKKYLEKRLQKEEVESVYNTYKFQTKLLIPLFVIQLFFFKIIRMLIVTFLFIK